MFSLLLTAGFAACGSTDRMLARDLHLELSERIGFIPGHVTLCVEMRPDRSVWLIDRELVFTAVSADGTVSRYSRRIGTVEPERWALFYTHLTEADLARWLGQSGDYEVSARIGPVRTNSITLRRQCPDALKPMDAVK